MKTLRDRLYRTLVAAPLFRLGRHPAGATRFRRGHYRALEAGIPPDFGDPRLRRLLDGLDRSNIYALPPFSLAFLYQQVRRCRPLHVVELGSGASTLVLALAARRLKQDGHPRPRITSVEQDAAWMADVDVRLQAMGLRDLVDLHCLPMTGGEDDLASHGYATTPAWLQQQAGPQPFDFVFIDGPGAQFGRHNTLPPLLPFLAPGTPVLLDDADRPREREAVARWLADHPGRLADEGHLCLGHGIRRLRVFPSPSR